MSAVLAPTRDAAAPRAVVPEPLVVATDLKRHFDVSRPWLERTLSREPRRVLKAVDGVSFRIPRGGTFALVGESGSGKSTVARLVVGLLKPTGGEVTIDGVSMTDPREAARRRALRRRIQMVFQDPFASLNPRMSVGAIVEEPIRAFGLADDRAASRARVGELLALVGLSPADAAKYPHQFSGGQRQRVAIARALASQADFLVADEPTSALDVSVQAQVLNLMGELQERLGLTQLFISHNLAVVRHVASEVGVMYLGRLVEVAPTQRLFREPRHPYARMLLEAVPDLAMTGRARRAVGGEVPSPISPPPGCTFHPRCPLANERCRVEVPRLIDGAACHAVEEGRG